MEYDATFPSRATTFVHLGNSYYLMKEFVALICIVYMYDYIAINEQAITWANIGPDLCRHMTSLDHN